MPLWHIPARQSFRADAALALRQIEERLASGAIAVDARAVDERRAHYAGLHEARARGLAAREAVPAAGAPITPELLTACVRAAIDDDTIVLSEGITNYRRDRRPPGAAAPGTLLTSGGGSLGWCGGAAIGVKLARPDSTVITLSGDGSYLFSIPSAVHWMARRYKTPFLQVIYDNGGWKAPRFSALSVHPAGHASAADGKALGLSFAPAPDHAGIAAASGGAFARTVTRPDEVAPALAESLDIVRREKRCAVLDVKLAQIFYPLRSPSPSAGGGSGRGQTLRVGRPRPLSLNPPPADGGGDWKDGRESEGPLLQKVIRAATRRSSPRRRARPSPMCTATPAARA